MLKKIFTPKRLDWVISADSQTGPHKPNNEDYTDFHKTPALAVLCDGVGGNACGEVASQLTCELLSLQLAELDVDALTTQVLKDLVKSIHAKLLQHMQVHPQTQGMATTLTLAIQNGPYAWVVWVGDSRIYLIRNNTLQQLTHDHSFVNEKVAQGVFSPAEAAAHPMANLITSSLGGNPNSLKHIGCQRIKLKRKDRLILCSDGTYDYMSKDQLLTAGQQSAQALTTLAIENDTHDNCSAVCIEIQ